MSRRTLFRLPHSCSLKDLLAALVARTNKCRGPHRPQVTTLTPCVAEAAGLPAFINMQVSQLVGFVYAEQPSLAHPFGEPLLFASFRPVPERGWLCDGIFSGEVVVDVWQDENYPLTEAEVDWFMADYCGCEGHQWLRVTGCWRKLQMICEEDLPGSIPDLPAVNPSPNAQANACPKKTKRRRTTQGPRLGCGKPRKFHAKWLMDQMRLLQNLDDFDHLFPAWLHVYEETEGHLPANPRTHFIQTAQACAERIRHERNHR